jgi:ribosomal protein S18 acetylase RimI-like enzyme
VPTAHLGLAPLSIDPASAIDLTRAALVAAFSRSATAAEAEPRIEALTRKIQGGEHLDARLARQGSSSVGITFWDVGHPRGVIVQTLYLLPDVAGPAEYGAFLDALAAEVGVPVFLPGGLTGLSDEAEDALMRQRGFARFARSEMRWPAERVVPPVRPPEGVVLRSVNPEDESTIATLHLAAFGGTFDQSMYLSDADPVVDAARAVHEMMTGNFGEFLGWASSLATRRGQPVGASLVVRAPYGPLLISVMVDRRDQGGGIGRSLVATNLAALRARGETFAALNVTEGNRRAVALYEHLGFVRSLGPEHAWYSQAAVPVAPGEVLSAPPPRPAASTPDSAAHRTPRT